MDVRLESLFPSPVLHPGVVLQQQFLERFEISQGELAEAIGVESTNLCTVIHGRRRVTLRLGRLLAMALGTSPEFWLLRQLAWDLDHARPLPPLALLPQLRDPRADGTRPRSGLYLRRNPMSAEPRWSLGSEPGRKRDRPALRSAG